ncbi:MAG TPA: hypothetical protein VGD52_17735 [Pseudoduganella sp.]
MQKLETWEMTSLDWSFPGVGGATISPAEVNDLILAENDEQATSAYYAVADVLCHNGWVYPCAVTVIRTILAALPKCGLKARGRCLALIASAVVGEPAPGAGQVIEECLLEARNATWYFIFGIQFDDVELAGLYADVLGCLGLRFEDLRHVAVKYLEMALTRELLWNDPIMIQNTIADLKSK